MSGQDPTLLKFWHEDLGTMTSFTVGENSHVTSGGQNIDEYRLIVIFRPFYWTALTGFIETAALSNSLDQWGLGRSRFKRYSQAPKRDQTLSYFLWFQRESQWRKVSGSGQTDSPTRLTSSLFWSRKCFWIPRALKSKEILFEDCSHSETMNVFGSFSCSHPGVNWFWTCSNLWSPH
jgi:hypothetical protein